MVVTSISLRLTVQAKSWSWFHIFSIFLTFQHLLTPTSALGHVPNSPCESVCQDSYAGTLSVDTVCLDNEYTSRPGSLLQECVTCQLNSTAVDPTTNISDVNWALFNMRYTLSECMFAYPIEIVSISTPCQVSCQPLMRATTYGITAETGNDTSLVTPDLAFCSHSFDDEIINKCAFCYGFVPQQLFMANFLQALHIACREPPTSGAAFYPDGRAIFNETAIQGPSPPHAVQDTHTGLHGWKLALVIALPVVGGTLLFAGTCFCCFRFTRRRRANMAASGRMSRFYDKSQSYSPGGANTPASTSGKVWSPADDPPQEMQNIHTTTAAAGSYDNYSHSVGDEHESVVAGKQPASMIPLGHQTARGPAKGAQARWSDQRMTSETTPLSSPANTMGGHGLEPLGDDVGPGSGQVQDPNLHERYFGVTAGGAGAGEDETETAGVQQQTAYVPYRDEIQSHEQGRWVQ